jgi:hypothetical protein
MPALSKSNRKPSNRKASSYGFYSKYFTEEEKQMLDEPFDADLMLEIALTRLHLARLLARQKHPDKTKSPHIP